MSSFGPTTLIKQPKPKLDEEITFLLEKIKTGKANSHDLFVAIDHDSFYYDIFILFLKVIPNGKIDKIEFQSLA